MSCDCEGCGHSGGVAPEVPNRPGLPALAYRVATHPQFARAMISRLAGYEVGDPPQRPLADLSTRERTDPAIALIDAWAAVGDVLTFYTERIANEGFLRTSTERRSVLELARTIGYELNPGVAAGGSLAFTVEDAPGSPGQADVPVGTKVQSVPAQGEKPQTFETVERIEARSEWNAMPARTTRPQPIGFGLRQLYLQGIATRLRPGDAILLVGSERRSDPGSERWDVRILDEVEEDREKGRTLVRWSTGLGSVIPHVEPAAHPAVYAFRSSSSVFGHNAPDWRAMPLEVKQAYAPPSPGGGWTDPGQWPGFRILPDVTKPVLDLDGYNARIIPDSWVAFVVPGYVELFRVTLAEPSSHTDFTLTAKTTRLRLDTTENLTGTVFGLRESLVLTEPAELALAEEPVTGALPTDEFVLAGARTPLPPGRRVIVSGRTVEGADAHEVAFVAEMAPDGADTRLRLAQRLHTTFDIETVTVAGNVAAATHGESVTEVLGSGRGELANQEFTLRRPPLTYVSASTPSGASSTLVVRVDGVAWAEQRSLFGLDGHSPSFIVRLDDDGTTRVVFGDGRGGARLPTGTENVRAEYRTGIGLPGNLAAGQLSLLMTRPLGVRSVTNPVASSGGDDPERRDDARRNAPNTVLTLDRIVSLSDYSDFARAFAGIAKAVAATLWDGERQLVHVTVAGVGGADVSGDLFGTLGAGIEQARDPVVQVLLGGFTRRTVAVRAGVRTDPLRVRDEVLAAVRAALGDAFSFDRRDFGQPVTAAEVTATVQQVPGVVACAVDELYPLDVPPQDHTLQQVIPAEPATWDPVAGHAVAAQLLFLDTGAIVLEEMA